ncbi:MAG: hypothetical protein AB7D33_07360 [Sphingobium sp.]
MLIGTGLAGLSLAAAVPLIAQQGPTSLLPPGFGDASPAEEPTQEPQAPSPSPASSQQTQPGKPALQLDLSGVGAGDAVSNIVTEAELTPEELAEQQKKYDLPARARRSLDRVGPLSPATGGVAPGAFGQASGKYLATLMREAKAPFVSRWASILLRRALLSAVDTPGDIDGADWVAERAWLLVRMGEADSARMLVQSVDNDRFSPRLYAVAMQVYLASADPIGLCPLYQGAKARSTSPSWTMAEAICASFSAEQGRASAILNQTERRGRTRGIDYRLTEKAVGAGANARRSVKIEWDGVEQLTAWRYGLATALNVDIPAPLMNGAGRQVLAWQARAPMLALQKRLPGVETAARLGVFSGSALVDYYAELDGNDAAPDDFQARANAVRLAYGAPDVDDRIDAMRSLWGEEGHRNILAMLAISRAAAALPVTAVDGADFSSLIAAMLSAGYDISAERWAKAGAVLQEAGAADGWAMLAVGAPRMVVDVPVDRLRDYVGQDGPRGKMLLAGLMALDRARGEEIGQIASEAGLVTHARTRWEQAIDGAAGRGEKATVALLVAIGMQVSDWRRMPPEHLYHIVSALRRVGLDPAARMIAVEAIMRT